MSPKGARRPILGLDGLVHGPTRLALLWALYHQGESGYKQIEETTRIPRASVCTQALRLVDAGLVEIRTERRNRRPVTLVSITAEGRHRLEAHAKAYRDMQQGAPFVHGRKADPEARGGGTHGAQTGVLAGDTSRA